MRTADGLALRHERKYLITAGEHVELSARLACLFHRDPHAGPTGEYHIRSLYFDDLHNSALHDKNAGLLHRTKYRIRFYDCNDRVIRFERKRKEGVWTVKESLAITRADCMQILAGNWTSLAGWPEETPGAVLAREIAVVAGACLLVPKVIVDYVREAYVGPGDLRITFDKALAMAEPAVDPFWAQLPTQRIQSPDNRSLDVKYDDWIPSMDGVILESGRLVQTSASKYVLCRARQLNIR